MDEEVLPGNAADPIVDGEIHAHLNELDKLLDRETETEEEGERDKRQEGEEDSESSFHRDISFRDILPLDDWHLSPASPPGWRESESEESSAVDEDPRVEPMRRFVAQLASHSKNVSMNISSIVLNLKVSQVLLQQCESSLNTVETCLERRQLDMGRVDDEVDAGMRLRDAPQSHHTGSCSSSHASSFSRAVGPPSETYCLRPRKLYPQVRSEQYDRSIFSDIFTNPDSVTDQPYSVW